METKLLTVWELHSLIIDAFSATDLSWVVRRVSMYIDVVVSDDFITYCDLKRCVSVPNFFGIEREEEGIVFNYRADKW